MLEPLLEYMILSPNFMLFGKCPIKVRLESLLEDVITYISNCLTNKPRVCVCVLEPGCNFTAMHGP